MPCILVLDIGDLLLQNQGTSLKYKSLILPVCTVAGINLTNKQTRNNFERFCYM